MLSDERIRQIAEDIYCSEGTRAEIEHSIRTALAEAAQSVPVVGEPVAYLVPCQTMTGDVDMKLSFEPYGAFVGHSVGERVPLYAEPPTSITQAELDAKDARIRELEAAALDVCMAGSYESARLAVIQLNTVLRRPAKERQS